MGNISARRQQTIINYSNRHSYGRGQLEQCDDMHHMKQWFDKAHLIYESEGLDQKFFSFFLLDLPVNLVHHITGQLKKKKFNVSH